MQLTVTGKQIDIGDALRRYVEAGFEAILAKYFKSAVEAHVVMAREAHQVRAEISLHIGRGIVVNAGAAADDAQAAFDAAAERAAKRLRRHKRRLRDHHANLPAPGEPAPAGDDEATPPVEQTGAEADPGGPAVIAEIAGEPPRLTVGEAALRMDRAAAPVLLFRNCAHDELNLVYRRADGNIGWVDPMLDPARRGRRRAPSASGEV